MNNIINNLKQNPKIIFSIIIIIFTIYLMWIFNLDKRAIAIVTILIGFITNLFAGISLIVASIPIIGPVIIKIFSISFIWIVNLVGYLTSIVAIKKGYKKTIISHRIITTTLVIGIIIGYILGYLLPIN